MGAFDDLISGSAHRAQLLKASEAGAAALRVAETERYVRESNETVERALTILREAARKLEEGGVPVVIHKFTNASRTTTVMFSVGYEPDPAKPDQIDQHAAGIVMFTATHTALHIDRQARMRPRMAGDNYSGMSNAPIEQPVIEAVQWSMDEYTAAHGSV